MLPPFYYFVLLKQEQLVWQVLKLQQEQNKHEWKLRN